MKAFLLILCALLFVGCKLSDEESTLAKAGKEAAEKKKEPPPGSLTEQQVGVKFYPGSEIYNSKQYDENDRHYLEMGLATNDDAEKVKAFYENEIGAKAMPTVPPFYSIQRDANGRHYEVGYNTNDSSTTIVIKVSWPTR